MLRSILSCFPLEMCKLWKLKVITLMFFLVVFPDAIYFSSAICLLLGTRQLCEVCFSPLCRILNICTHLNYDFPTGTNSCMCKSCI